MSQARVERERIYQALDGVGLATGLQGGGPGAMFAITGAIDSYPTTAVAWYGVYPSYVDGTQKEGDEATYGGTGAPAVLALNVGSKVPPEGTPILCVYVNYWMFRYDG